MSQFLIITCNSQNGANVIKVKDIYVETEICHYQYKYILGHWIYNFEHCGSCVLLKLFIQW